MARENSEDKNIKKHSIKQEIKEWLQIIGFAVVIAFVINKFVIANSDVPSGSMEPTIMTHSRIMGSRLTYHFSDIKRGDVVIFDYGWRCPECREPVEGEKQGRCPFCDSPVNGSVETAHFVKRVIGIPGDIIDIHDGGVYLNNREQPLDEPYLSETMFPNETYHFEVPENRYFMMGDNRNFSSDARFWNNPYIEENKVIAKVYIQYFPRVKMVR